MRSKIIVAFVALSALTLSSASAFADEAKGPRPSFPMPAAAFKQRVDARQARAREHLEKRASSLPAAEAKALRDRFAEATAKVDAEVAKAIADGTVTQAEAAAVRAAAPHGGKGGHCDKSKKA